VCGGDGTDDGESESESVVGADSFVAESLEWLKEPGHVFSRDLGPLFVMVRIARP
jgi:hypothetical protein